MCGRKPTLSQEQQAVIQLVQEQSDMTINVR